MRAQDGSAICFYGPKVPKSGLDVKGRAGLASARRRRAESGAVDRALRRAQGRPPELTGAMAPAEAALAAVFGSFEGRISRTGPAARMTPEPGRTRKGSGGDPAECELQG